MDRITLRGLMARKLRLALTALAIVLGVTFVTGTLVLRDTLDRTLKNVVDQAYRHVSFEIRGDAAFATNTPAAVAGTADRHRVPESIAASVRRLPGVADVFGYVGGYAQFIAPNGTAIGKGPGKAIGLSFDPNRQLSPYQLVSGHAPATAHQVVMDKATAQKYHFKIGDSVRVLLPAGSQTFTISGFVTFGNDANMAGETLAEFDQAAAEQLFNARGYYSSISVLAKPGADNVELQHAIAKLLPPGIQVLSGQALAGQLTGALDNTVSRLTTLLLIFALISLFVGAFTIFNTFTITVGQRTRELALLRLVGASRRQVFASVLAEAALTGLVGALIGLGLGVIAALGLKALLGAFGVTLPPMSLVFEARTAVVALAVGIGVTVISAILPARRAVRIPPIAALAAQPDEDAHRTRRSRVIIGAAIALLGIVAVIGVQPSATLVGIGAVAIFIATAMLVPIIARPLSSMLGAPLVRLAGTPARLGRDNSMRNPLRTAQTAGALMIGVTLVSTIAVLGSSSSASTRNQIQAALTADYIITSSSVFSTSVPAIVSRLPQVSDTTVLYRGQFAVKDTVSTLTAASPNRLSETVSLRIAAGAGQQAMAAGQLLIDATTANSDHLHVGSTVPVTFAEAGTTPMRIGGIFAPNPTIGSYITGSAFFLTHYNNPLPNAVLVRTAPTTPPFAETLKRALIGYPNLTIQSHSQYESAEASSAAGKLGVIYALLALAIVIALIGVVNTLMLSVFERTREIGLLRAVGMKRRQVRAMITTESIIIALLGAIIGTVMGTGLGIALISSLNEGATTISVPIATLLAFLGSSVFLGAAAAIWPAQRAANLDVLAAIGSE